jgi:hypothetical protein
MSDIPQQYRLTRRDILRGAGAVAGGAAVAGTVKLLGPEQNRRETVGTAKFLALRDRIDTKDTFLPNNPEEPLNREVTDNIFDNLRLDERFPETINKDTFHLIAQKPARIATLFYQKEGGVTQEEFNENCKDFFKLMSDFSDYMKVDFPAVLLMFQISGDANNSAKAQTRDHLDEAARVGMTLAESLASNGPISLFVDGMRTLNLGWYYSVARLEGPVSVGIHDIEVMMVLRQLQDLKKSLPDEWNGLEEKLAKISPLFIENFEKYKDEYDKFEVESDRISEELDANKNLTAYLTKYIQNDTLHDLLTRGEKVDSYQYTRTTVFWAQVTELEQLYNASSFTYTRKQLEAEALEKTIDYYQSLPDTKAIFFDQIENPKLIRRLKADAESGYVEAQKLLDMAMSIKVASDEAIAYDREFAGMIAQDGTEFNLTFQMFTGVAYARGLLNNVRKLNGHESGEAKFDTPDELAWTAFQANMDRETGASFLMAGTRPLLRATLPFVRPEVTNQVLQDFVKKVYLKHENQHPNKDYQKFSQKFLKLLEERVIKHLIGVPRYVLDSDTKGREFIEDSKDFGYEHNLVTIPHSSSLRAFEATAGYIATMNSN